VPTLPQSWVEVELFRPLVLYATLVYVLSLDNTHSEEPIDNACKRAGRFMGLPELELNPRGLKGIRGISYHR
jgi:hypothetical protein